MVQLVNFFPINPYDGLAPKEVIVGIYRQACSGIPLAVGFLGRDQWLWNSMVQGTRRFRQVRAASSVIPYVLCGGLYCLRCRCVSRGVPARPYIFGGTGLHGKSQPTTVGVLLQHDRVVFLCTAASSMPIRVVTKEVGYIHELSLTLEHSMPISSPAVPGLTPGVRQIQS